MNGLFIDLIIVIIIAVSAFVSAKRGFVRTLVEVVGGILVIYFVVSMSTPAAEIIYEKTVEPAIVSSVEKKVKKSTENVSEKIWNSFPKIVTKNADFLGVSKTDISKNVDNETSDIAKVTASAADNIVRPFIVKLLSMFISIILAIILLFLVRLLAKMLNSVFNISVIGKINRTLGGILGIFKGLVYSTVFCIVIMFILSIYHDGFSIFTEESINSTFIFKNIYCILPFKF